MPPATNALLVLLAGLSGLLLVGAGRSWFKVGRVTVPAERLQNAATLTGLALLMLGSSLILLAILSVPWGG